MKTGLSAPGQAREPATERRDPYYVRGVGKALEVVELLRHAHRPLTLSELASRLGLGKSSTLRICHTLAVHQYVETDAQGRYRARPDASAGLPRGLLARLIAASQGPLRELVREFRESVGLAVLFDNHIEVVQVVESPEVVRMGNTVGRIIPPHASALGKCIAAFQSEERRERLLRSYGIVRFTANTIVDERQLQEEFARIARQGYAVDAEESTLHGYCFGAPVRAPDGEVIGAISISPPVVRLAQHDQQAMIRRVIEAARTISEALGSAGRVPAESSPAP